MKYKSLPETIRVKLSGLNDLDNENLSGLRKRLLNFFNNKGVDVKNMGMIVRETGTLIFKIWKEDWNSIINLYKNEGYDFSGNRIEFSIVELD